MAPPLKAGQSSAEFTTAFVVEALVKDKLLDAQQGREVIAKENQARARVLKAKGVEAARYNISPVEIVAAFQIPAPGGRGVLDQDKVSECAARAAGIAYRKLDAAWGQSVPLLSARWGACAGSR